MFRSKLRSNIGPAKRMVPKHLLTTLPGLIRLGLVVGFCFASAQAQQTLRWGADPSGGAPYVFNDPNHPDQYIGYEKEMVDALAAAMGRKPEFVPSDWETLVSSLQRGSFDVIVNGLEPTGDRARQIQFSKPYYIFQLALTVRSDEQQIHTLADCRTRVVGTLGNTAASRLLQKEDVSFKGYAEPLTAYRDLELKRIDAVLMDVPAEVYYVSKSTALKRATEPFFRGTYNVGLRKSDDALNKEIDAAIDKIIRDGSLEQILRKWNLWNDAQVELQTSTRAGQSNNNAAYEITSTTFNWREAMWRLAPAAVVAVRVGSASVLMGA